MIRLLTKIFEPSVSCQGSGLSHLRKMEFKHNFLRSNVYKNQKASDTRSKGSGEAQIAQPGSLLCNDKGIPGTLGCIVYSNTTKEPMLLTNQHVLFGKGGKSGEAVWLVDTTTVDPIFNPLGTTSMGVLKPIPFEKEHYFIDAATVRLGLNDFLDLITHSPMSSITGVAKARIGEKVKKVGGASHITYGIISDIGYTDTVYFKGRVHPAPNQIVVVPRSKSKEKSSASFSKAGDSGAVLLNLENKVVGLLWGSNSKGESIACHIEPVLKALDVYIPENVHKNNIMTKLYKLLDKFKIDL